jgi:hypothetical protein
VRAVAAACRERLTALRTDLDRLSQRQVGWLVFLATLCVYSLLTPRVVRNRWLTGDEPHYLVATHSIAYDRDLRLDNNYEDKDFLAFYVGDDLGPALHAAEATDGYLYPIRGPGFSLLLAPAYFLAGRAGVLYFLDLVGALLAMSFYLLACQVTRSRGAALAAWVLVSFTPLMVVYNFLVYPEVLGALLLVWGLSLTLGIARRQGSEKARPRDLMLIGLLVALLPWLSARFIALGGMLLISAVAYAWRNSYRLPRWQTIVCLLSPCVVSGLFYFAYNYSLFRSISPLAAYDIAGQRVSGLLFRVDLTGLATAVAGWLLEPRRGLFINAPVYLLCLPGILLLLRHRRREACLLLPYPTVVYASICWLGLVFAGWEISPRQLVWIMPILGIFIAYALTVISRLSFRIIALALLVIGLVSAHYILVDPVTPYASTMVAKYNRWDKLDLSRYVPHFLLDFFMPGQVGFAGVGALVEDDQLEGCMPPPMFRARIQGVIHTGTAPEDEGYAFIADLARDAFILPRGAYEAHWFLKIWDNTSGETVAIVDVLDPAGEVISSREIVASDFEGTGTYQRFSLPFEYSLEAADRGEPILRLFSTGREDLWIAALEVQVVTAIPTWPLAGLWLIGIGIFTAFYGLRPGGEPSVASRLPSVGVTVAPRKPSVFFPVASAILALLIAAGLANYLASMRYPRLFEAENLRRLVGQVRPDPQASGGKAVHASPGDPEGMLVYGPYEFFPPGLYVAKFSMKIAGSTESPALVAHIDVFGGGSGVLTTVPILASDFKEDEHYRTFRLWFDNPLQQALQFRVYSFPAGTELWVDRITLSKLE